MVSSRGPPLPPLGAEIFPWYSLTLVPECGPCSELQSPGDEVGSRQAETDPSPRGSRVMIPRARLQWSEMSGCRLLWYPWQGFFIEPQRWTRPPWDDEDKEERT